MLVTGSTAQIAENSETMVETCPFDESLESLDPYNQTLESDDDEDWLCTVTQDEDQPSPIASHMTVAELDVPYTGSTIRIKRECCRNYKLIL